jgi:hypothetical protein
VKPKNPAYISLTDLKKCTNVSLFFDMIFDIQKYDMHIRRIDPIFREQDDIWIEDGEKRYKLEYVFIQFFYSVLSIENVNDKILYL